MKCKKHKWSHKGFEWYEGINTKTGKIFGRHICLKCGKVDNFRPLKKASGEAVAQQSQLDNIRKLHFEKFGKPFIK